MTFSSLTAISPIDGRYRSKIKLLSDYYSEFAFLKYRTLVECEYFIALSNQVPQLVAISKKDIENIRLIYINFTIEDAEKIKEIEKVTNHDIKAVEYFIKEKFDALGLSNYKEFIHFALTSQDINNTAIPLMVKNSLTTIYLPQLNEVIDLLKAKSIEWIDKPMLARTHGQAATPTTVGRELEVFIERLEVQKNQLLQIPYSAKFGGATGGLNAHYVAYPDTDWKNFCNLFIESLGLKRSQRTTQIEHYDNLAALFDAIKRINTILLDLSRDCWMYISMDYFKQKIVTGEVGSSAMPHKVNPIDFENAEGNLGLANATFKHLSEKLPVSRLQRDLSDSTAMRNIGVPLGHTLIAFGSILKGIGKLQLNEDKLNADLDNNWAVVSEAIQTILRRENYPQPYEALKNLTRGNQQITKQSIHIFIDTLKVSETIKQELKQITPFNYLGK